MSDVPQYAKLVLLPPQQFAQDAMKDTGYQEIPVSVALIVAEHAVQQHQTAYHAKLASEERDPLVLINVRLVVSNTVINVTLMSLNVKDANLVMFCLLDLHHNVLNAYLDALTAILIKFSNV